jgi:adenylate kinase family enzyme
VTARLRPPRYLLCVVGPPAIGKSVVAESVSGALEGTVFQLRSFARTCRVEGWLPANARVAVTAQDWDGDTSVVETVLRQAFVHGRFAAPGRYVILDDFPRTADELLLLKGVGRLVDTRLGVVELTAADLTLMTRCHHRRVCLGCTSDPGGEPHEPAEAMPGLPDQCPECGGPLAVRRSDQTAAFIDRVDEYRSRRSALRNAAAASAVPVVAVDAAPELAAVCAAVKAAAVELVAQSAEGHDGQADE